MDSTYRDSLYEVTGRRDRDANGGGVASYIGTAFPARRRKDLVSESIENISYEKQKMDSTYRHSLYEVPGRRDRDANGGGVASYIWTEFPARRRKDLVSESIENVSYENSRSSTMACSKLKVFQKPQLLVQFRNSTTFINKEVIAELKTIQKHLVVVSVIGSYRTGKSWILNRLAKCDPGEGFCVLDGQTAVTQGIWIFCRDHPCKENCVFVFLDTEGLCDPLKKYTTNEDNKLFLVALLQCNILIYNVKENFDNSDIEKLGFMTQLTKQLQTKKSFPELVLLVRDVTTLKLDGRVVEPNEYLSKVLSSGDQSLLSPKTCISENFQKRSCFKLTMPVDFEERDKLGQIDQPALKETYLKDENLLIKHLKEADVMRVVTGSACTVRVFCDTLASTVKFVEDGHIPEMVSMQVQHVRDENERVYSTEKDSFKTSMRDDKSTTLYGSLKEKYFRLRNYAIQRLKLNLIPENYEQLDTTIERFKKFAEEEFLSISLEKCSETLAMLIDPIINDFDDGKYTPPHGEEEFNLEIAYAKRKYYEELVNFGHEKSYVWEQEERKLRNCQKELQLRDEVFLMDKKKSRLKKKNRIVKNSQDSFSWQVDAGQQQQIMVGVPDHDRRRPKALLISIEGEEGENSQTVLDKFYSFF